MSKSIFSSRHKRRVPWLRMAAGLAAIAAALYAAFGGFGGGAPPPGDAAAPPPPGALTEAQAKWDAGDMPGARAALAPLLEDAGGAPLEALLLDASIVEREGKLAEAAARLEETLAAHANHPQRPEIAVRLARLLDGLARHDEATALYREVERTAPSGLRAGAYLGLGAAQERAGAKAAARDLYRKAMQDAAYDSPVWNEAVDRLGQMNVALVFSPEATPESRTYAIEAGDNLTAIGIKLNTTQGLLLRANGLTETSGLQVGQRLKYTPKDFRVVVERSTRRLYLVDKDGLFKRYMTGLGKPGYETALGKYTVGNKQKDPTWFRPGGAPVPPGDPENELGTRWMPLVPAEAGLPADLGIHGTIAPETIGQYASRGCPRMKREEVEELYDLIVRSTPVDIVETIEPRDLEPAAAVAAAGP